MKGRLKKVVSAIQLTFQYVSFIMIKKMKMHPADGAPFNTCSLVRNKTCSEYEKTQHEIINGMLTVLTHLLMLTNPIVHIQHK